MSALVGKLSFRCMQVAIYLLCFSCLYHAASPSFLIWRVYLVALPAIPFYVLPNWREFGVNISEVNFLTLVNMDARNKSLVIKTLRYE
ncbi:hypothetical protein ASE74_04675 [Pedobacter sp. Leaf216]|nr:hypothetical protein ASE74_04675 [Pedobacter sp. Leaf216]